jgi:hypothetical protein
MLRSCCHNHAEVEQLVLSQFIKYIYMNMIDAVPAVARPHDNCRLQMYLFFPLPAPLSLSACVMTTSVFHSGESTHDRKMAIFYRSPFLRS